MHVVEPKAFILAESKVKGEGMTNFLEAIGAGQWWQSWDPPVKASDGELLVEIAGRTCYKSFGTELNKNLTCTRSDHHEYIGNILRTKHGSVLEHSSATVGFVGVSRIFTHELVRHRAGCAYSQESMRFVRLEDVGIYVPNGIKQDPKARYIFEMAVAAAETAYKDLTELLVKDDMPFAKKKELTSAIRRIAPSGHSTNIVVTANHRAWRHLFELRTARGVEEEIGVVFGQLGQDFRQRYPALYQDMSVNNYDDQVWPTLLFENSKI